MTDPATVRYVVLTESESAHLVAIRHDGWQWLRIVAVFANRDRAESYAEVENDMLADDPEISWPEDINAKPPEIGDPGSNLREAVARLTNGVDRPSTSQRPRRSLQEGNAAVVTLADEIVSALPQMIEKYPYGPNANQISEWLSAPDGDVRRAMRTLHQANRATLMRRSDSKSHHLVPVKYRPPRELLTSKQNDVFMAICESARNGVARISRNDICARAGTSKGGIDAVLAALINKGRIALIERGHGVTPSTIKVLDTAKVEIMDIYRQGAPQ